MLWVGLLFASLLGGCLQVDGNHPPTAELSANPLVGYAPLNVTFTQRGYDADGDGLTMTLFSDSPQAGIGYVGNSARKPPNDWTTDGIIGFPSAGTYTVTLIVSDGRANATDSVVIRVLGEPIPVVLNGTSEVAQTCPLCSGGMPPHVGTVRPLGATACGGFRSGQNGTDCVWYLLPAEWEGLTFFANATDDADADVELRSDCTLGPQEVERIYVHEGLERETIPPGARCAVVWIYYKAPATVTFLVYA